jgi:outer membrane protein OmpA-like peptidoglycan-associated protein
MNTRLISLTLLAAAALAACSSVPERNNALEQARTRYAAAQRDTQVATLAPEELKRAGESLRAADQAWSGNEKPATVDHLAYMTTQRVAIAQETANGLAAQAVTAGAGAERDRLRLDVRTREADAAQQKLAVAQDVNAQKTAENAQKTAELAAAEAAAAQERARVERRDAKVSDLEMQLKELNARKTDRGMVVTLGDVLFDSGKSQLLADGNRNIGKLAEFFKRNPERMATVEGYTDSVGTADSNQQLSERRATAVVSALVSLGVPSNHLSMRAHGEDMPTATNDTAAGRQMNRRVEIVFTPLASDTATKSP